MRRLLIPYISCIRHILPSEREKLTLRGIDHRRPLRMMDGIDQRRAGSTAVDPYGCGGFITVDDAGSTAVDPYGCGGFITVDDAGSTAVDPYG